jgi:glycosyltransferase involved in cell wall biosynthesis
VTARMRVLLVASDLYKNSGGGQAVYKKLIESSPEIDFFYFRTTASDGTRRPANAKALPLQPLSKLPLLSPPPSVGYVNEAFREADRVASSVAGQSFDIVDIPDFVTFGGALRAAFANHGVKMGRLVLAMHGNISESIAMNWTGGADSIFEQRILERAQFSAADGIYAISPRYMREWQTIVKRVIHYIDPAHFASAQAPIDAWRPPQRSRPSLYCVGRSERRKGNDLFVELVRWLDPSTFDIAAHIGDQDVSFARGSAHLLADIAEARGIRVEHRPALNREGLLKLFGASSIAVLPVRYDSLNLIALDALFSGCPVAVSSKAGVCDYLDQTHPNLPYIKIDLDNFYASVPRIRDLVDNYDSHRCLLHERLIQYPPLPVSRPDIGSVYDAILAGPPLDQNTQFSLPLVEYKSLPKPGRAVDLKGAPADRAISRKPGAPRLLSRGLLRRLYKARPRIWGPSRKLSKALARFVEGEISSSKSRYFGDPRYFSTTVDSLQIHRRLEQVSSQRESNQDALKERLQANYRNGTSPLFRCNFWLDIARIERLRGNELIAVPYELRVLRLLGDDRIGLLPRVADTLTKHGFKHEAQAARAMFGDPARAEERVYALLQAAFDRLRKYEAKPFEILDDRRSGDPSVAIIVSLYKAADKLPHFLTAIAQQTLVRQGKVEFILVDSGSPTQERQALEAFLQHEPLNVVYARSQARETIQAAWNRGIGLARAPYLVFLGADETLYPETLEVLAQELDDNPDVDWVMSNSLVTAVDANGLYEKDIMPYDRSGAGKDHVYLETCYLSWVGGMYRKSIHDRCGYYDEDFGAAGDTEFKNRVLPHINVKYVDRGLGLFLNYPEGQTTASPRAELEDLRAWYMHRTSGGLRYAFENRPVEDAEALLRQTLGYRKSYCRHISSDIEYGAYLARYIKTRKPDSAVARSVDAGLADMLQKLRDLEFSERLPRRRQSFALMFGARRAAMRYQRSHRLALGPSANPRYELLNDNRYEQHSWLWRSN